jgi:hypothetical protein
MREIYKDLDTVVDIKKKTLEWIVYVARMDRGRTVKKVFESKREGNRRRGRHKRRRLKDVEKDLREMMIKRWRQMAVDREEWASEIKGAKILRGPQGRTVVVNCLNG